MIAGTPETFAVLTEKVSGWRSEDKISGILHICINGVAYPRKPRPTDVERDIRRLFDESVSAFACPKISRKLFGRKGRKLFNRLREMRFPQYYSTDSEAKEDRRYDAVFIGPATAGYHVFVLSDGQNVRLLIGRRKKRKHGGRLRYIDDVTISAEEYQRTVSRLYLFYRGTIEGGSAQRTPERAEGSEVKS